MPRNTFRIDEELESPFHWGQLKRAIGYVARYKKNIITVFFTTITSIVLSLCVPLLTRTAIDDYIPSGNIPGLMKLGGLMFLILAACISLNTLRYRLNSISGQGIIRDIRSDLYRHLQKLPFEYYDSRPAGKIYVRVVNYVNSVADFLSSGLINIVLEVIAMFIITGFMFYLSPTLSWVALSGLPFLAVFVFTTKPIQRRALLLRNNKQSNLTAYLSENINGVRITQSFTRQSYNLDIFRSLQEETRKYYMRAARIMHLMWPVTMILARIVSAVIYISAVYYLRNNLHPDEITVGTIITMVSFTWRFWGPVQNLGNHYNNLLSTASYLERIFQVLDEPVTVSDAPNAYELPTIDGAVSFRDVTFSYEKGIPVLKNVSFEVKAGNSIALVGPTGAGKTTIINLLSRFYNKDSGAILIDGHDINEVTAASLRGQMGIMLQDTFIFSGNIIENIRFGRLDATDEECIEAAKAVRADTFISKLPDGYYTEVDERGEGFSAGQRQLLSFARTILSEPRILILDEATSSIDTQTERLVQEGISTLLKGRTSFVVAHRLSTIMNCTRIMYINDGVIAESGSHDELMKRRGLYYQLYMSQLQ